MNPTASSPHGHSSLLLTAIICVSLLILGNLWLIFGFSSESREESGARSREITRSIARIAYSRFDYLPEAEQDGIVDSLHGFVRKAAHFTEFGLLGCLTACLGRLLGAYFGWKQALPQTAGIPACFCLLIAVADETYQIFTNRGASPVDVCIDFSGALCGVLLLHAVIRLWSVTRRKRRDTDRKEDESP